jgi:hypothetical protein
MVRAIPAYLDYINVSYILEIVKQPHETIPLEEWVFRARKERDGTTCVILGVLVDRTRLLEQLRNGFDVEAETPAATLMDRLVRDGVAEKARARRR